MIQTLRVKLARAWLLTVIAAFLVCASAPNAPAASVFVGNVPDVSWHVDGVVYTTLQVGNTVYVGGDFKNAVAPDGTTVMRKNLAAFNMDNGQLLTSFKADATNWVRSLATDGQSLYVGGIFTSIGGQTRNRIGKVNLATGAVDPSFAPSLNDAVRAIEVDGNNLFIGGNFTTLNGATRNRIAKIDKSTGAVVSSFTATANNSVYALKLSPVARTLFVGGNFATLSGVSRNGLGSIDADTGVTTGVVFANSAKPTFALDTNEDGSKLFGSGGSFTNATASWTVATGVRNWRVVTDGDNQAMDYYDGVVYFGFHDGYQGNNRLKLLAADASTGVVDTSFEPSFDQFWGSWTVNVSARGLVVGGDFTTVSGVAATGFARFKAISAPPPLPTTVSLLGTNSPWAYWDQGTTPTNWNGAAFDDSSWPTGPPRLGYGDTFDDTIIGYGPSASRKYITSYFRAHFNLTTIPDSLSLFLSDDDGAVAYLDGSEVARDDLATGTITSSTLALTNRSAGQETALTQFTVDPSLLHLGDNVLAVEVHQYAANSSDLGLDAELDGVFSTNPPPADQAPIADFTASMSQLTGTFDGTPSSDPDGTVASYYWDFGDGTTAIGANAVHTFAAGGTYNVTLSVLDNQGALSSTTKQVNAVSPDTTVIANGASWRWYFDTTAPPANWKSPAFDSSSRNLGSAILGYGHSSVVTNIDRWSASTANRPKAAYFIDSFQVSDVSKVTQLVLTTVANDGVVVYVNGTEVGRSNMPAGAVTFTTSASSARSTATANSSPVVLSVPTSLLVNGINVVAVETHLNYRASADLTFDLKAVLTTAP